MHLISKALNVYEIKRNKRVGIILFDNLKKDLPILEFSVITYKYNLYIGGLNGNI